jgi:hypothetical protein
MGSAKRGHIPKIKGQQRFLPFHTAIADMSKDVMSVHSVALIAIAINHPAINALVEGSHAVGSAYGFASGTIWSNRTAARPR